MNVDYRKISLDLISALPSRMKEVVSRRFSLSARSGERETLEKIGKSFGITRERVRQIEESGLEKIRPEIKKYPKVFQSIFEYFQRNGGIKKEAILLLDLGQEQYQNQIFFLLSLDKKFERISESEDFFAFWMTDKNSQEAAKKMVDSAYRKLQEIKRPLSFKEFNLQQSYGEKEIISYLEISKKIQQSSEGLYGLREWPEINPRGIKDKAYLIFKKMGKPLHFTEVTNLIQGSLTQTVHNELIRDPRFVLVGRGIYALSEWGYTPGQVKDVIEAVLKGAKGPLTKEQILNEVSKQRMVKENTILLNLSNRNNFQRDPQGKYTIREI